MTLYGAPRPTPPPEPPPAWWRGLLANRTALVAIAATVVLLVVGGVSAAVMLGGPTEPAGATAADPHASTPASPAASGGAGAGDTISMSATGDIILGSAPGGLPPNNGKGFFDPVRDALQADLQMGNLEQPLTDDTGVSKCGNSQPPPGQRRTCFAFRAPPSYAGVLKDAGFDLMTLANNHAYDFGEPGHRNTQKALEAVGIEHTGSPGQITVVEVKGIRVAVIGFASYTWSQDVTDLEAAMQLVTEATKKADLVVVQVHMGAEGADKTHVKPGAEMFLGENRGDPIAFSHAVIDAGADLVVGHGPHVVRGMEFYKGRLIAYSLGNFSGYNALSYNGVVGVGGVLKVTLARDGSWHGGQLVPTKMVAPGLPRPDAEKQAISLVRSLSRADFPGTGAAIGADGTISPR